MNITTNNPTVGAYCNITLSLDRTKNRDGSTITPSSIGTSNYNILITFDPSYTIYTGNTSINGITSYTINSADKTILVIYNSALLNSTSINITVLGIRNPLISSTALSTYVKISDSNNVLKDTAYNSFTYSFATFVVTNDISYNFNPGNVSTISNLTLNIKSALYSASAGMYVELSFRKWWMRTLVLTTSTVIFSTGSACVPLCIINRQTDATLILFSNSSLSAVYSSTTQSLTLILTGIQSPPSLEEVDQVQIVIREPQYGSIVQKTDSLLLGATGPNSMESITPTTASTIS